MPLQHQVETDHTQQPFGGTKYKPTHPSRTIEEEEEVMEQAMAEAQEDEWLDDGAIEIGSDEEYH